MIKVIQTTIHHLNYQNLGEKGYGYKVQQEANQIQEEYSIEDCILEYINQYNKQVDQGTKSDISYKAFTRMFYSSGEEKGKNEEYQQKLKEKINKNGRYRIDGQYSSSGNPIFYHISKNNLEMDEIDDKNPNMYKIYLNCERKNIARLTGEILKKIDKIDDCAFRMKFLAESVESEVSKRYQRNDKIVIYTANEIDKERIINGIIDLRKEKENLFSNKKQLPLIPKVNGFIGCTKQGKGMVNTPLYKNRFADTYNSKLATIMEDCLTSSLREVSSRDPKLVYAINGYFGEDTKQYLKTFKSMNSEQIGQVVETFKNELIECCEKSNIDIDLGNETQKEQEEK